MTCKLAQSHGLAWVLEPTDANLRASGVIACYYLKSLYATQNLHIQIHDFYFHVETKDIRTQLSKK